MTEYSLRKSKKILTLLYRGFLKKKSEQASFVNTLKDLQNAILQKNSATASSLAQQAQVQYASFPKKHPVKRFLRFILGLSMALLVAIIIRQMWFELYEIPTGSMRPTFKEKDRVLVSKSKFGINFPLMTKHLYFDRDLLERMSTVVFTSENLNTADKDMLYFYLFPGKKQFVKRLIGKPGDTLYFYGGQVYGIDKEGNDITSELQNKHLEHIPFIRFEGSSLASPFIRQMGENVAKVSSGNQKGTMLASHFNDYYDLWGYKNYAMARLVYPSHLDFLEKKYLGEISSSLLLELHHSPSILRPPFGSRVAKSVTYIPLSEAHLSTLFNNLYTARFIVKKEHVFRYGSPQAQSNARLEKIPDGTYEFYDGKAYKIYPTGVAKQLPSTHPLYEFSIERLFLFYNIGIEFNAYYLPKAKDDFILPSRYAYFRNGDLFLLGKPLLSHDDPTLVRYSALEHKKEIALPLYKPFIDHGPPPNMDFIKKYGLKVPENHYLALGDNHAMSGDSRDFGFVPEENIKGSPSLIFWPPGSRWGLPSQPLIPWASFPNLVIWILGVTSLAIGSYISKRKTRFPIQFDS